MLPYRTGFAIALIAFAALLACKKTTADSTVTSSATLSADGKQRIAIQADEKGFTPSSVTLKKGQPAVLVFTRTTDDTCAKQVVFSEIGLKKDLPLNQPAEVEIPTAASRTLSFACGMGMFKGSVVVQ